MRICAQVISPAYGRPIREILDLTSHLRDTIALLISCPCWQRSGRGVYAWEVPHRSTEKARSGDEQVF